jgi:hypothetical protein
MVVGPRSDEERNGKMKKGCTQCITEADPGWHHIHRVEGSLPRRKSCKGSHVSHGWAVELSGEGFSRWTFFPALPPAVVFARSGRSSGTIYRVDIRRAAIETRSLGYDVHALLLSDEQVDCHSEQAIEAIRIWPSGLDDSSVAWRHPTGYRAA